LLQICKDFGCLERYNELAINEVYQKRKKYMRTIADYTMAAVNLYGVIHVTELQTLIHKYENKFDDKGYNHVDGSYKNTVMFTPEFICTCTLHQLIGDSVPVICTTMDGFLLHSCFLSSYKNEHEKMLQFFKGTKRESRVKVRYKFTTVSSGLELRDSRDAQNQPTLYYIDTTWFIRANSHNSEYWKEIN
jgi:hypothetical protein